MRIFTLGWALAIGLGLGLFSEAQAGGRSDSKVKITAEPGKVEAGGKQKIILNIEILKGWHLYANPVNNPDYVSNQTNITVKGNIQPNKILIAYPAGKLHREKVGNKVDEFMIWEDRVQIPVTVYRQDNTAIDFHIRVSACDANTCVPSSTVRVTVP